MVCLNKKCQLFDIICLYFSRQTCYNTHMESQKTNNSELCHYLDGLNEDVEAYEELDFSRDRNNYSIIDIKRAIRALRYSEVS
jgi:hypothetical protein